MFLFHCIALSVDTTHILIVETMFSSQNNVFLLHFFHVLNVPSLYISFYDFILCSLVHLYTRFFIDRCNHFSVLLFSRSFCHCPTFRFNHNVGLMLGHCLQCRINIEPTMHQRLVIASQHQCSCKNISGFWTIFEKSATSLVHRVRRWPNSKPALEKKTGDLIITVWIEPGEHGTLAQCWLEVGQPPTTLA